MKLLIVKKEYVTDGHYLMLSTNTTQNSAMEKVT